MFYNYGDYEAIPKNLMDGLGRYVKDRIETGSFLRACLENDCHEAAMRATPEVLGHLPAIMRFIYNELPDECWGSEAEVEKWLSERPEPA